MEDGRSNEEFPPFRPRHRAKIPNDAEACDAPKRGGGLLLLVTGLTPTPVGPVSAQIS
jgi:hypothetical protein